MRFIKSALTGAALFALLSGPALADAASEAFVQENATLVLESLDNPDLDQAARTEQFSAYINEFSNFDRISNFVIGKYARRFEREDLLRYRAAFRAYNLAAYEAQFDEYRGSNITVTGSTDRSERDSIVDSILRSSDGEEVDVRWRVLLRNGEHEVVDVALNVDGNLLWLAIEQRAQFLDLLDRENGSPNALIAKLEELTADLVAENQSS
ncbi:MAG: ABC transporter substrate-binding protein [Pseudomonadota bacterium]